MNWDTGNDSPAASFIDKPGKFVLLLYHNDTNGSLPASSVTLDNAHASFPVLTRRTNHQILPQFRRLQVV
ncbi:MAG: hypothetical protein CM1200mP29_00160 [Verrucomicrobiota bacterium]|nr:MAG: hypothetical protein CM1200mP29_00160 [Verrucomicrobiota bacterium]